MSGIKTKDVIKSSLGLKGPNVEIMCGQVVSTTINHVMFAIPTGQVYQVSRKFCEKGTVLDYERYTAHLKKRGIETKRPYSPKKRTKKIRPFGLIDDMDYVHHDQVTASGRRCVDMNDFTAFIMRGVSDPIKMCCELLLLMGIEEKVTNHATITVNHDEFHMTYRNMPKGPQKMAMNRMLRKELEPFLQENSLSEAKFLKLMAKATKLPEIKEHLCKKIQEAAPKK